MKIAIVILNWNGTHLLEQFLPSIIFYSKEAAIYLADNASTDNSVAFVKAHFPTIKIIQNDANYGFAKGYNEALQFVEEPIYALVNSDIEVSENWLQPVLYAFESELQTAIIQPKILNYKNKDYFEYAGAAGGFIDQYGYPFCRGRIFDTMEKDIGQYDSNIEITWASGACFFIRKKVFRDLDGFDADFFAHQEEIDLCWRAINKGHKIKYIWNTTVYHVGGATLQLGNPKKTYLNFRNSLLMLTKNLPKSSVYRVLIIRMILDGVAGFRFLLKGNLSHFTAILKAHCSFYRMFAAQYKKRGDLQQETYYKVKSIVYNYYFLGRKTFKNLF